MTGYYLGLHVLTQLIRRQVPDQGSSDTHLSWGKSSPFYTTCQGHYGTKGTKGTKTEWWCFSTSESAVVRDLKHICVKKCGRQAARMGQVCDILMMRCV